VIRITVIIFREEVFVYIVDCWLGDFDIFSGAWLNAVNITCCDFVKLARAQSKSGRKT
jgi:hypothetical protein